MRKEYSKPEIKSISLFIDSCIAAGSDVNNEFPIVESFIIDETPIAGDLEI